MVCIFAVLTVVVIGYYIARYLWELIPMGNMHRRAVLITGCDTGFGHMLAVKCANAGMTVFAGCLTEQGETSIRKETANSSGRVETLPLDITKDDAVKKAVEFVKSKLHNELELWSLVNNAGIFSCYGPDDWCTTDDYQRSFDVNTLGMIRVTAAFKPLLKQSRGRIISVTSVAGRVSVPFGAPYACAKYAAEAYMDALRQEIRPFGVTCCILEPGLCKATHLLDDSAMDKRVSFVWNRLPEEGRREYGEDYREHFRHTWNETMHSLGSARADYVVDSYFHAITARYPRLRYRCGWDALLFYVPLSYLPTEMGDALMRIVTGYYPPAALK